MVESAASAKVLVLLLLKDMRYAAVATMKNNAFPFFFLYWSFVHEEAGGIIPSQECLQPTLICCAHQILLSYCHLYSYEDV